MIPPLYLRFIPSACAGVPTCATAPRRAAGLSSPIPRSAWPRMAWPCRTPARRVRRQSRTGAFAARIGARGYTTLTNVGEKPSRNVRRTPRVARCHKIVTRLGGLNRLGIALDWLAHGRAARCRQIGRSAGRISPAPLPRPAVQCASARATRRCSREPAPARNPCALKVQYYAMTKNNNPLLAIWPPIRRLGRPCGVAPCPRLVPLFHPRGDTLFRVSPWMENGKWTFHVHFPRKHVENGKWKTEKRPLKNYCKITVDTTSIIMIHYAPSALGRSDGKATKSRAERPKGNRQ